ncbi:MAG TPA: hypothetical protein PKN34_10445, partial [Azospira sp.]|nr:hypothetical protein [Azospira sp.]
NRNRGNSIVGSNPTLSATRLILAVSPFSFDLGPRGTVCGRLRAVQRLAHQPGQTSLDPWSGQRHS